MSSCVISTKQEAISFSGGTRQAPISGEIQKGCVRNPKIEFFMYHYIRDFDTRDSTTIRDLSVPPALFKSHMETVNKLAKNGRVFLMKGQDFLDAMKSDCYPGNPIWIFTADDGWSDMHDNLVPIASRYDVPFFLGITTDFVGKKGFITLENLVEMSKSPLITLSSHSLNHSDNAKLDEQKEKVQVCESKSWLEQKTGKIIETYIYPSGRMNLEIDEKILQDCGYMLAWTTGFGRNYDSSTGSLYNLNRVRIHGDTKAEFFNKVLARYSSSKIHH